MESKLINYSIFIEKRPDMEIHTEVAIVSCINSAYVLLDGECASLISQVDKFNMVDDRSQLDTNHELYRTDFELGQLQEALVFQVQYVLNMGNDFTVGGGSYSIGNINSSYSRPEGRELIAPGVYKLLSNARVYHLNAFGSFSNHNTNEIPLSTSKEIMERVKNEYVAQNQPNAQVGNVAYINQSHQVSFGSPQDLQITTYNTNRIAGPEGYRNNFYEIDSVPNIAFFGPDYNGTYSAVHRQEMIDYVNQNAGENLGQEIAQIKQEQEEQNNNISNNANEISSLKAKDTEQNNRLTQLEQETEDNFNEIANIKTKDQQQDNSIQSNTTNIQTNTNNITLLDGRLLSVSGLLNQTIDGLRTLKPFQYVGEYQNGTSYKINQLVSYQNNLYLSKEDNNNTTPPSNKWLLINKDTVSVDLSDYPTKLEVEAIKNNLQQSITSNTTNITNNQTNITNLENRTNTIEQNYVSKTTTTPQTIASQITFTQTDMVLKFNSGTNNSAYLAGFKSNNQRVWYFGKGSSTSDNFIIGADRGVIKLEPSTHVDTSNKKIINVADPTADQDAANKRYVDNKVNTNTTNITTIRNNYLDKTATGAQQIAATSLYVNNQLVVNTPYNPIMTPNADLYVSGEGFIENLEADNATFNTSIIVPTPTQNDHAATKQYVDNAIANSGGTGSGGSIDTSNFVSKNTNTEQVIEGPITFRRSVSAPATPLRASDLTNKQYVDNQISQIPNGTYNVIFSNTSTFNNLNTLSPINIPSNTALNKPWIIQFDRMGNNGNKYEGTINYAFILPDINQATFAGNSFWYNSTNKRFDSGANAGITILRTNNNTLQLTIQCWDGGNRISKIRLYAPK